MDHTLAVDRNQDIEELLGNPRFQYLVQPLVHGLPETATLNQFEHQAVLLLALDKVVKLTDVGVVERGEDLGLAEKTGLADRIEAVILPDELEGDPPTEVFVEPDIDRAHSTLPELPHHPEVAHPGLLGARKLTIRHLRILRLSRNSLRICDVIAKSPDPAACRVCPGSRRIRPFPLQSQGPILIGAGLGSGGFPPSGSLSTTRPLLHASSGHNGL